MRRDRSTLTFQRKLQPHARRKPAWISSVPMSTATTQDLWVEGHAGRLFVRSWSPAPQHSDIPLVIFHDSLGCVELWRGFLRACGCSLR